MKASTLKDIAKETKLSTTTVSIILNNKASHISNATKELVMETARRMNYKPNRVARSLVTNQSKCLGLILPDISNPFFSEMAKGVYDEAIKRNYTVIFVNTNDDTEQDTHYIDYMVSNYVDGLIIATAADIRKERIRHSIKKLEECHFPVVLIDRHEENNKLLSVLTDHKYGAYLATKHLIEMGHVRIGCITGPLNVPCSNARLYGYMEALQEHNVKFDSNLIYEADFHFSSGENGVAPLVKKKATAIFAFNDIIAYGVYRGSKALKLKIPHDISVVGFDDLLYSSIIDVPLTTVNQPVYCIGKKAVENLICEIEGTLPCEERVHTFTPSLMVRESTRKIDSRWSI